MTEFQKLVEVVQNYLYAKESLRKRGSKAWVELHPDARRLYGWCCSGPISIQVCPDEIWVTTEDEWLTITEKEMPHPDRFLVLYRQEPPEAVDISEPY